MSLRAFRVWAIWPDDPDADCMASAAFSKRQRADALAVSCNAEHCKLTDVTDRYVVREEQIPRAITFQGKPSRVVMIILDDNDGPTDVSWLPDANRSKTRPHPRRRT